MTTIDSLNIKSDPGIEETEELELDNETKNTREISHFIIITLKNKLKTKIHLIVKREGNCFILMAEDYLICSSQQYQMLF